MVAKNLDGIVPEPGELTAADAALLAEADALLDRVRRSFDEPAMHQGLEAIWQVLGSANRYFTAQEPWVLRKSADPADQQRFAAVLYTTMEVVRIAALLVQPIMPTAADALLDLLSQPADRRDFGALAVRLAPGRPCRPTGVFPDTRSSDGNGAAPTPRRALPRHQVELKVMTPNGYTRSSKSSIPRSSGATPARTSFTRPCTRCSTASGRSSPSTPSSPTPR